MNRAERLWLSAFSALLGALPDHLGQFRLASLYLRARPRRAPLVLVQQMRSGIRAALDLGDRTQGLAYLTRRYDPELTGFIVSRVRPGGVFVDVGAHVGLISLSVARARPTARVLAIEPRASNAEAWAVNRDINAIANAELARTAVAHRAGRLGFSEAEDSAAGHLSTAGAATVDVTTLDELARDRGIASIDVLKIDTEGAERAVLEGARGLLARGAVATVVCELNSAHLARQGQRPEEITGLLREAGFHQVPLPAARNRLHRRPIEPPAIVDVAFERTPARDVQAGR